MSLTKFERLVLANQYEILKVLRPQEADGYAELEHIIRNGYEVFYDQLTLSIADPMPADRGEEVINILSMFRAIHDGLGRQEHSHPWAKFAGFDGNGEPVELGLVHFIIEVEGKFQELRRPDLNSHMPTLATYRAMLKEWRRSADRFRLTREDIERILAASDKA
jgi:uncharacterized protein YfbU (UPF0304 family)